MGEFFFMLSVEICSYHAAICEKSPPLLADCFFFSFFFFFYHLACCCCGPEALQGFNLVYVGVPSVSNCIFETWKSKIIRKVHSDPFSGCLFRVWWLRGCCVSRSKHRHGVISVLETCIAGFCAPQTELNCRSLLIEPDGEKNLVMLHVCGKSFEG